MLQEAVKTSKRIEPKPNTQLSSTGKLVTKWSEETVERTKFDRDTRQSRETW